MASLPPQRPTPRHSPSSRRGTASPSTTPRGERSHSPSTQSADSQTLALPSPSQSSRTPQEQQSSKAPADDTEPRKCWICFQDETDDGPNASPWRSPCPCALTAHEQCLLDWVADMEAPTPSRATAAQKHIQCPQCKTEIYLHRPRSLIVEFIGRIEKLSNTLLIPGVVTGLVCGAYIVLSHHGAFTIHMICGFEDAEQILSFEKHVSIQNQDAYLPAIIGSWIRHWRSKRVELGLPLIPLSLIASRITLTDGYLPALPILFFGTLSQNDDELTSSFWPPSLALTLSVLPYLRDTYNEFMERVWADRERAWIKEMRPRIGGEEAANLEDHDVQENDGDADDMIEVEFDVEIAGGGDEEPANEADEHDVANAPPPIPRNGAPALEAPPQDHDHGRDRARGEAQRAAEERVAAQVEHIVQDAAAARGAHAENNHNINNNGRRRRREQYEIELFSMAEVVLGALAFPGVCAGVGETLRLMLPVSWTTLPQAPTGRSSIPTGMLQTRWGRSIVGGCMFVVLKDALRIYCRWRMLQSFRQRHVQDYDKKRHGGEAHQTIG